MNDQEPEWLLMSWVRLVQARWMVTGVPRRDREELLHQLLHDLAAARAGGARIEELIATHPRTFADSCAAGLRSRYNPIGVGGLLAVCLGTGAAGAAAAWLCFLSLVNIGIEPPAGFHEGIFYLLIDLGLIAAVLLAMVGAARWRFRRYTEVAALTPRLAIGLASAIVIGFPLASLYGSRWAYSQNPLGIGLEALIVLTFLACGIVAAHGWTRLQDRANRRGVTSASA